MLKVFDKVGQPSWLRQPSENEDEKWAQYLLLKLPFLMPTMTQDEIYESLDQARKCGRNFFAAKKFVKARGMYGCIIAIAGRISHLPLHEHSLLYSSFALCCLKLNCPFDCIESSQTAINLDCGNIKAFHHLAMSLYMIYNFDEALRYIARGLLLDPKCFELIKLRKCVDMNKIPRKFSEKLIADRVMLYLTKNNIKMDLITGARNVDVSQLIFFDDHGMRNPFLMEAKLITNHMDAIAKECLSVGCFDMAYNTLVDLQHIYFVMNGKYGKKVDNMILFHIFYNMALCLFYKEDFVEALKKCDNAKRLLSNDIELMMLEAQILCKMNDPDEARKLMNKCFPRIIPNSCDAVLFEEILFKIQMHMGFSQNSSKDVDMNLDTSSSSLSSSFPFHVTSELPISSKNTHVAKDLEDKVVIVDKCGDLETLKTNGKTKMCELCNVEIGGSLRSLVEHKSGKRHKKLLMESEFVDAKVCRDHEYNNDIAQSNHSLEMNDIYDDAMSNSEFYSVPSGSCSIRSSPMKCSMTSEESSITGDYVSKEVKVGIVDKCGDSKTLKTNGKTKRCELCNVEIGSSLRSLVEHRSGKRHKNLLMESEFVDSKVCRDLEYNSGMAESNLSLEMNDIYDDAMSNSEFYSVPSGSCAIRSSPMRCSITSKERSITGDSVSKDVDDKKLKISNKGFIPPKAKENRVLKAPKLRKKKMKNARVSKANVETWTQNNSTVGSLHNKSESEENNPEEGSTVEIAESVFGHEEDENSFADDICYNEWVSVQSKMKRNDVKENRNVNLDPSEVFPLSVVEYNIRIVCLNCVNSPNKNHSCMENTLSVQNKSTTKRKFIRERSDDSFFPGDYKLCINKPCFKGILCSFAHSKEERIVWNEEKRNRFSIHEFIQRHRSQNAPAMQPTKSVNIKSSSTNCILDVDKQSELEDESPDQVTDRKLEIPITAFLSPKMIGKNVPKTSKQRRKRVKSSAASETNSESQVFESSSVSSFLSNCEGTKSEQMLSKKNYETNVGHEENIGISAKKVTCSKLDSFHINIEGNDEKGSTNINLNPSEKFPLPPEKYNIRLICPQCTNSPNKNHSCLENTLSVQNKLTGAWTVIRERNNNLFIGNYRLCVSEKPCPHGYACNFAHSEEEKIIWNAEKMDKFSIYEFFKIHKSKNTPPLRPKSSSGNCTTAIVDCKMNADNSSMEVNCSEWNVIRLNLKGNDEKMNKNINLDSFEKFPLPTVEYNIRIICTECANSLNKNHRCLENTLSVQSNKPTSEWIIIRERNEHGSFYGSYRLCANNKPCFRGNACNFAHSEEEKIMWNAEKMNKFSIYEFIKMHRSKCAPVLHSVDILYQKYPGYLRHVCGACFLIRKSIIGNTEDGLFCRNRSDKHNWVKSKIILHQNDLTGAMTPVFQKSKNKVFEICPDFKYCSKKGTKCLRAHSQLEKEVWIFMHENNWAETELVSKFNELQVPKPVSSGPPHVVKRICHSCWLKNIVSYEDPYFRFCTGYAKHPWRDNTSFYIPTAKKEIRFLPKIIPRNQEFRICRLIAQNKPCNFNDCQFAHCAEELQVWKWMAATGNCDLNMVIKKCKEGNVQEMRLSSSSNSGLPSSSNAWVPPPLKTWSPLPKGPVYSILREETYFCFYCDKTFDSKKLQDIHNNSKKHMDKVANDNDMQWNFRTPPFNSKFELCKKHEQQQCCYSNVPDECNFCTHAHGQSELDEWNERIRWKNKKWTTAEHEHLISASSELIKAYEESETKSNIISDSIDGVQITTSEELLYRNTNKKCEKTWTFVVISESKPLEKVYLLKQQGRMNFSLLRHTDQKSKQYLNGEQLQIGDGPLKYQVLVKFDCAMFGSFCQSVIFDFGMRPVASKTIRCEIGSHSSLTKFSSIRSSLSLNRWSPSNQKIISYSTGNVLSISTKYSLKDIDEIMQDQTILMEMNECNYRSKMHGLLYMEELSHSQLISKYNLRTSIELDNKVEQSEGGWQMCSNGELYGKITLSETVIEGSVLFKNIQNVLFKPIKEEDSTNIYEVSIPDFEELSMKHITGESIFILLPARCCTELGLSAGEVLEAEVQFQPDRQSFCRMHHTIDKMKHLQLLFPRLKRTIMNADRQLKCPDLNENQNKVLAYVSMQGSNFLPPLVIYGPFGTGKTETMAKASLMLANQRNEHKILICTKSNLTADEYFKRYFCNQEYSEVRTIRVYDENRKIKTVDENVLKHCILASNGRNFRCPTKEDISNCQIIVTTLETSYYLSPYISDELSHIFIDEAGQDLECRTIIPLVLANEKTCIVIAGDHMQMGEEVFNEEARNQNFNYSLMERLLHYYKKSKHCEKLPTVFLNENYRNHKEILAFISKIYYGSKEALVSRIPVSQDKFRPLEFFAVYGGEVYDKDTASKYNLAEVEEIVCRVSFLYENWPEEWGEKDASQILVTSSHMDQIRYIRRALRRTSKLGSVTVVKVQNVPGLEFRAVFLSTVRTSSIDKQSFKDTDFLTQIKLLNSAFSRAKSYLAVVGDPVTLCCTGECSKIWIAFLLKCQELHSINPEDMTVDKIKEECILRQSHFREVDMECETSTVFDESGWEGGFQLKADEIIKQLLNECSINEEDFFCTISDSADRIACNSVELATTNNLNLYYCLTDDFSKECQLQDLLNHQPDVYKRCRMQMMKSKKIVARPCEAQMNEIVIPSKKCCQTAIDRDEVVVKIFNKEDVEDPSKEIRGEVVGILNRDISDRMFICYVEETNVRVMVPINLVIPKIRILVGKSAKNSDSLISIFKFDNNKVEFKRNVKVNALDPHAMLFVVRFLKWEIGHHIPLGIVLAMVKPGNTIEDAMKILEIEHNIPKRYDPKKTIKIPKSLKNSNRDDYRDMLIFTIDSEHTTDLDDAIGFKGLTPDTFLLSIHIADVSFYIDAHSPLDEEARERVTSFYPIIGDAIHMLPELYSSDVCSLKPGVDRPALSIFIKLDRSGELCEEKISIKRTLIKSKFRLSYNEVEKVLADDIDATPKYPSNLIMALKNIRDITSKWRKERLGSDATQWNLDIFALDGPNSRKLVEELMIQANRIVARLLLRKFPKSTPLRVQTPPNENELNEWKKRFSSVACQSFGMRRYLKPFLESCRCEGYCECVEETQRVNIDVPKQLCREILSALETRTADALPSLIFDLEKYPQMVVALNFLQKIQERSEYVCSGNVSSLGRSHFSLNVDAYTHFTSPIRRYIDLVVHRLLVNCIENTQPSHTEADITEICRHCTKVSGRSKQYENATQVALMCSVLQDMPLKINATVLKIGEKLDIELHSMLWHPFFKSKLRVRLAHLDLEVQPVLQSSDGQPVTESGLGDESVINDDSMWLVWSKRIYSAIKPSDENRTEGGVLDSKRFYSSIQLAHINRRDYRVLDSKRMVTTLTSSEWKSRLKCAQKLLSSKDIGSFTFSGFNHGEDHESFDDDEEELNSDGQIEMKDTMDNCFCKFSKKVKSADLLKIQLVSRIERGLMQPYIQMIPLTKLTRICTEHNADPVRCFANIDHIKCTSASKDEYDSVTDYKHLWCPAIFIECAHSSVTNGVPAIIHNVWIEWNEVKDEHVASFTGKFQLNKSFCDMKMLRYFCLDPDRRKLPENIRGNITYACIQYRNIELETTDIHPTIRPLLSKKHKVDLIYHCHIKRLSMKVGDAIEFTCFVNQQSYKLSNELVRYIMSRKELATIEWIELSWPLSQMMNSIHALNTASDLAINIALGKEIVSTNDAPIKVVYPTYSEKPNYKQEKAIDLAMKSEFSLIQGPPGTGKTFVIGCLVYLFCESNKKADQEQLMCCGPSNKSVDVITTTLLKHPAKWQVMCCGPSNKSVDVIATALLKYRGMVLLRVYSEHRENEDFPLPVLVGFQKKKLRQRDKGVDVAMKDITLHYLIRDKEKYPNTKEFVEFEKELIQSKCRDEEAIKEYKTLKRETEMFFLHRADVILMTCTSCGSRRIDECNIKQLLIDECAMCMEPESMVPIVETRAEKVVLIGDHKQLRPIVTQKLAAKLGLETSLFERYHKKAIMLTKQYRMHEAIAEFPSNQFYGGELETGTANQKSPSKYNFWPGGKHFPIAFLNIFGVEEGLAASTAEGGIDSKKNQKEAEYVVKLAFNLHNHHKVKQENILILSQYRAQCTLISKLLESKFLGSVPVQTVISAQGSERDYVILSTVRSLPKNEIQHNPSSSWKKKHLGFITDYHQINVALTRAKKGLIILGNRELLSVDEMWKDLIDHYADRGALIEYKMFPLLYP